MLGVFLDGQVPGARVCFFPGACHGQAVFVCTDHAEAIEGDEGVFEHDGAQGRQVYVSTWALGVWRPVLCILSFSWESVKCWGPVLCFLFSFSPVPVNVRDNAWASANRVDDSVPRARVGLE